MVNDENVYVKLNFNLMNMIEKMNFKWNLIIKNDYLQNYFQNNFLLRMFRKDCLYQFY